MQINTVLLNQYVNKVFPLPLFSMNTSYMKEVQEKIVEQFENETGTDIAG
ncbi:MAG: hypothetical protein P4L27_00605 [Ignavibacteriaceae bacterium]|nr:hypothetical protein [Ignavibacteriaceae bacterium]